MGGRAAGWGIELRPRLAIIVELEGCGDGRAAKPPACALLVTVFEFARNI